ncbi:MAG: substrate-binding domain-containing protein [Sedimentisphaeraceae bacterium JB056]
MVNTLSRNDMQSRARKYLEKQLVSLDSGEQFPPIRELMQESGIGRVRIDNIMDEFESKGLIKRYPGKGVFKTEATQEVLVPYVDIIACGIDVSIRSGISFFSELIAIFSSEAARLHQGIRLHEIPVGEPSSSYEMLFRRPDVKACVLMGLHSPYVTELFDKHEVAWVSLFPNSSYGFKRSIVPSEDVVKLQLEHLWSLGHERIAYLHGVNDKIPSRSLSLRRESFYRLMAEKGLQVYPEWVCYTSYRDTDIEAACEKLFSLQPKPTAIIAPDPILPSMYRFLERRGLYPGKDISIVANDDLSIVRHISPSATTVHMPMELVIKRTLETLQDAIMGKSIPDIYQVPAKLIVRESTVSIN